MALRRRPHRRARGLPAQVGVRREHEPRDPHADERRARDDLAAARDRARPGAARLRRHDRQLRRDAAHRHRRHPRLLQDRGRPARPRGGRLRAAPARRGRGQPARRHRPRPRARGRRLGRPGAAPRPARRPAPPAAGPVEPREQRREVHRARRGRRARAAGRRRVRRPLLGARHRHRHHAGAADAAVRAVPAGRRLDDPALRRHRPRADDQPSARGAARGQHRRRQHARGRLDLLVRGAAARPRRSATPAPRRTWFDDVRALVVDDNATNRTVLEQHLSAWSVETTCAADAETALRLLREAAAQGRPYDVAVLDRHMPGTDGLQPGAARARRPGAARRAPGRPELQRRRR